MKIFKGGEDDVDIKNNVRNIDRIPDFQDI